MHIRKVLVRRRDFVSCSWADPIIQVNDHNNHTMNRISLNMEHSLIDLEDYIFIDPAVDKAPATSDGYLDLVSGLSPEAGENLTDVASSDDTDMEIGRRVGHGRVNEYINERIDSVRVR